MVCHREGVLGTLLYLLYSNDMKSVCKCNLFRYVDNLASLVTHKGLQQGYNEGSLDIDLNVHVGNGNLTKLRE